MHAAEEGKRKRQGMIGPRMGRMIIKRGARTIEFWGYSRKRVRVEVETAIRVIQKIRVIRGKKSRWSGRGPPMSGPPNPSSVVSFLAPHGPPLIIVRDGDAEDPGIA